MAVKKKYASAGVLGRGLDEIGSGLKVRQMQNEKRELFEQLEEYYRATCN